MLGRSILTRLTYCAGTVQSSANANMHDDAVNRLATMAQLLEFVSLSPTHPPTENKPLSALFNVEEYTCFSTYPTHNTVDLFPFVPRNQTTVLHRASSLRGLPVEITEQFEAGNGKTVIGGTSEVTG